MILKSIRYANKDKDSSGSVLFVNDVHFGFVCEDEKRAVKVDGETRIPEGVYEIKIRDAGTMNKKYKAKYPFHRGMLHLQDVPGFEWIYIHVGNDESHTAGCLLIGYGGKVVRDTGENKTTDSVDAYTDLYNLILLAVERGEKITIEIKEIQL